MQTRSLGPLSVTVVGLGCNNFGGRIDQHATTAVVNAAIEAGINFFDTADIYGGGGGSERMLGVALGAHRDQVLVASKFGMAMPDGSRGAHPDYVHAACEASLRRLGTDHLDLYQLHKPDPDIPIAETLGALEELVAAGKVRAIGHSNMSAEQITQAHHRAHELAVTPFVSSQERWNLLERDVEREVIPAVAEHGLGMLPYYPLASGLLTGKYTREQPADASWRLSKLADEDKRRQLSDERFERVEALSAFARQHGRSLLELAFSWLAAQPVVASVIAGATRPEQVFANVAAIDWTLSGDDLEAVDQITAS